MPVRIDPEIKRRIHFGFINSINEIDIPVISLNNGIRKYTKIRATEVLIKVNTKVSPINCLIRSYLLEPWTFFIAISFVRVDAFEIDRLTKLISARMIINIPTTILNR